MSKWEYNVAEIKFPQQLGGKTLSHNAISCLKFSGFIITRLSFTVFVYKGFYRHKRLYEV